MFEQQMMFDSNISVETNISIDKNKQVSFFEGTQIPSAVSLGVFTLRLHACVLKRYVKHQSLDTHIASSQRKDKTTFAIPDFSLLLW